MANSSSSLGGIVCVDRVAAGVPFAVAGGVAIVAGGVVAAAVAHHPTQPLVWMVAYLVLVVGVMQVVFGIGQAWLAECVPTTAATWGQWLVFNLANAGVVAGTLCHRTPWVAFGTVLFAVALAWFLWGVRRCRSRRWGVAYRVLLALMLASACVGLVISVVSHHPR